MYSIDIDWLKFIEQKLIRLQTLLQSELKTCRWAPRFVSCIRQSGWPDEFEKKSAKIYLNPFFV
jgi:hypothetical protein